MEDEIVVRQKTGGRQKGTLNKRTMILKELGIETYKDIFEMLLVSWIELLNHEDVTIRLIAMKELSKYVFRYDIESTTKKLLNETSFDFFQ